MNTKFPGRPDYTGPTSGWFGLLHHSELFEKSHNVVERVEYVKQYKSPHEVKVRLWNMIYLDPQECAAIKMYDALDTDYDAKCDALDVMRFFEQFTDYEAKRALLDDEYNAKRATLDTDYLAKCALLDADYMAKRATLDPEILAYIRSQIPDCAWDDTKNELIFPEAA